MGKQKKEKKRGKKKEKQMWIHKMGIMKFENKTELKTKIYTLLPDIYFQSV